MVEEARNPDVDNLIPNEKQQTVSSGSTANPVALEATW